MKKIALPLLLACIAAHAAAQQPPVGTAREGTPDVPQAAAVRATQPIRVDGTLNEAAWQTATPIREFRQLDPQEGAAATERTEVRVLYDDQAIYIGARLYDRQPVSARLGRRDMSMSASDWPPG